MSEEREFLRFPGYVSVKEAASILGFKEDRVWYYIRLQRLASRKIDGRSMITEESVRNFRVKPRGRVRADPPPWHVYRGGAKVYTLQIDIQVRSGKQEEWRAKLQVTLEEQEYLFFGTMQRYIFSDKENPNNITIQLVWKDTELADEARLTRDVETFKADFADVLDWETARYTTKQALIHT
jgi:hypothetical protein